MSGRPIIFFGDERESQRPYHPEWDRYGPWPPRFRNRRRGGGGGKKEDKKKDEKKPYFTYREMVCMLLAASAVTGPAVSLFYGMLVFLQIKMNEAMMLQVQQLLHK